MKRLVLLLILASSVWSPAQTVTADVNILYQPIDGFGASSAFAGLVPASVINTEYSSSGIGLKYIRVNLVPDYADCIAAYGSGNCVSVASGATISTADLANTQAAVANGAVLWATEWSPPGSMKSNGSYATGGNLIGNPDNYTALAAAQASFVTFMTKTYGIPVYAISVQNEPNVSTKYPSCIWSSTQFVEYVPYLHDALAAAGYPNTKIMIAEPGHWNYSYMQRTMSNPTVAPLVGILAAHAYVGGSPPTTPSFLPIEHGYSLSPTQHIWETEVSDEHGTFDGTMKNGLGYAIAIHNWLTIAHVNSWHYWEISGQNYNDNQGLTSKTNEMTKRAFVIGNWARFVTGMSEVAATENPQAGIYVTAFVNVASGAAVIVAVNTNPGPISQAFTIAGRQDPFSDRPAPTAYSVTPYVTDPDQNLAVQKPLAVSRENFTATLSASSVTSFVIPPIGGGHRTR